MTSREDLIALRQKVQEVLEDGRAFPPEVLSAQIVLVFEQEHTPTDHHVDHHDDEREALAEVIEPYFGRAVDYNDGTRDDEGLADAILAAGFRRTVQGEPSEHGPDWSDWGIDHPEEGPSCKCGYNGTPEECAASRVQGEPSDAEVLAALNALNPRAATDSLGDWAKPNRDAMRAALRAVAAVREEGQGR